MVPFGYHDFFILNLPGSRMFKILTGLTFNFLILVQIFLLVSLTSDFHPYGVNILMKWCQDRGQVLFSIAFWILFALYFPIIMQIFIFRATRNYCFIWTSSCQLLCMGDKTRICSSNLSAPYDKSYSWHQYCTFALCIQKSLWVYRCRQGKNHLTHIHSSTYWNLIIFSLAGLYSASSSSPRLSSIQQTTTTSCKISIIINL